MKMALLQITIDLDNDAFDDDGIEVALVLDQITSHIIDDDFSPNLWTNVHDTNGNPVGKFKVDPDAEPSFS